MSAVALGSAGLLAAMQQSLFDLPFYALDDVDLAQLTSPARPLHRRIRSDPTEIDWVQLFALMGQLAPEASFIPEIWQGHKNNGEGAWLALERLEGCVDLSQQRQVA